MKCGSTFRLIIVLFMFFFLLVSQAQNHKDSLLSIIKASKSDTAKIKALNNLSWEFMSSNPDTAIQISNQALLLCEKAKSANAWPDRLLRFKADAYSNLSNYYRVIGDNVNALDFSHKSLEIDEALGNLKGIARGLSSLAGIYYNQGDYVKALDYFLKALSYVEQLNDRTYLCALNGNIGLIYWSLGDFQKALTFHRKALKIAEEINNQNYLASTLGNIGNVYSGIKNYSLAIEYFVKSQNLHEKLGNTIEVARQLSNQGLAQEELGNLTIAQSLYFKALKLNDDAEAIDESSRVLGLIGVLYNKTKNYKLSYSYLNRSLIISDSLGALDYVKERLSDLSDLFAKSNISLPDSTGKLLNPEQMRLRALYYNKRFMSVKDSLFSEEKNKQSVRLEMNFEFDKKITASKNEQDKKDAAAEEEKKRQKLITYSIGSGLFLVLILALFIYRSYRQKQRANIIISAQKEEVEEKSKIIEEKNKDILDSINYAKRIQSAILANETDIKTHFPDSFLLYQPKDIVAGDFYFFEATKTHVFYAAADCTGHGVPGALVSVVCSNALTRSIREFGLNDPGEVLSKTRDLILDTFKKSGQDIKDGMDISLLSKAISKSEYKWAGANNPLWYLSGGEFKEITANKQPVGLSDNPLPFTSHILLVNKGDVIFLFTDGYADQFGGPKGKKFKYKQLQELLLGNYQNLSETKNILADQFEKWKGELEQIDDVCIIGIRV